MTQWTRVSSEPITSDRRTVVREVDGCRQGYASVRWNEFRNPELYGAVYSENCEYDMYGNVTSEPVRFELDSNPEFIC